MLLCRRRRELKQSGCARCTSFTHVPCPVACAHQHRASQLKHRAAQLAAAPRRTAAIRASLSHRLALSAAQVHLLHNQCTREKQLHSMFDVEVHSMARWSGATVVKSFSACLSDMAKAGLWHVMINVQGINCQM